VRERPILFCFDGSTEARHAIVYAATVIPSRWACVLSVGPLAAAADAYAAGGSGAVWFDRGLHEAVLRQAREGTELARRAGFDAVARGELGVEVWRTVVEVADDLDASLIVLGTRGVHGVQELIEGSVSHQVVRHAGRAVLVVPTVQSSGSELRRMRTWRGRGRARPLPPPARVPVARQPRISERAH
jgi:nucleotide-binding universal stress UspA family protein